MVTCLKFLKNILAAEFHIKSTLSKSEATLSSVTFTKVDSGFLSAYPLHASLHPCLYIVF